MASSLLNLSVATFFAIIFWPPVNLHTSSAVTYGLFPNHDKFYDLNPNIRVFKSFNVTMWLAKKQVKFYVTATYACHKIVHSI